MCYINIPLFILRTEHNRDVPELVYVVVFVIFSLFSAFAVVHYLKLKNSKGTFEDNLRYESYYSMLSFTSKILLLATLFTGVISRGDGRVQFSDEIRNSTIHNSCVFFVLHRNCFFKKTDTCTPYSPESEDDPTDWELYGTVIGTAGFSLILAILFQWQYKKALPAAELNAKINAQASSTLFF